MKRASLLVLISWSFLSCAERYPGTAREEMPGTYEAFGRKGTEILIMQSDGSYIHSFEGSDGYSHSQRGDWRYYAPMADDPDSRTRGYAHVSFFNWVSYQAYPEIDLARHAIHATYIGRGKRDRVMTVRPIDPESPELTFLKK